MGSLEKGRKMAQSVTDHLQFMFHMYSLYIFSLLYKHAYIQLIKGFAYIWTVHVQFM